MQSKAMSTSVRVSNTVEDIIEINRRSADAKDGIRIIELSNLNNIIPEDIAEAIRQSLFDRGVKVRQLTNQRAFQPWTKVKGFIEECQTVRSVSEDVLPIKAEVLIFNNTVAIYQVEPEVSVTIIEHEAFATQQKALFDNFWNIATPTPLNADGSTTIAVTIKRKPEDVYKYIANLANWHEFSEFAANFERVTDSEYIAHTSQGDIRVVAIFNPELMILDTQCILPSGEVQMIPYRVVPNGEGSELMMTNFKPQSSTKADYEEQLKWMDIELKKAKEILESR